MPINVWGLRPCWGLKYIDFSFILTLFILILFSDQGRMENYSWAQELEKHLQLKQGNFPNIQYLPEAGIPMISNKQAWPRTIHSGSMSKSKNVYKHFFMSAKYPGLCGALIWQSNLARLGQCIDEWYDCFSQGIKINQW